MDTRIYLVSGANLTRLVRAANKAQAIRHVVDDTLTCDVASQDKLVELCSKGTKVEDADAESAS